VSDAGFPLVATVSDRIEADVIFDFRFAAAGC